MYGYAAGRFIHPSDRKRGTTDNFSASDAFCQALGKRRLTAPDIANKLKNLAPFTLLPELLGEFESSV